ncbi:MAG: CZB domain-containing protein [Janthinobacterium lividum]
MTPNEIKQDFESAMTRHLSFKTKLRSFLYGNGYDEGPLRDPDQCSLGHWIAERRAGAYKDVPEMATLDAAHRHIHRDANVLMDHRLAGRPDAAAAGLPAVLAQAEGIADLLRTIERTLRTEA